MAKDLEKTRERMVRTIAAFRRSGKTRGEFAGEAGITVFKLDYWNRRVVGAKTGDRGSGASFVPVQLQLDNGAATADVEVVLAGGRAERVRIDQGVSGERLREILAALREC